jgi:hypothetical protein
MISVRNRRMIVPPEEKTLGVATDNNSSVRVFSIPRYSAHDIDLSAMAFFLEFRYEDGSTNETAFQDMIVSEDNIQLTWQILSTDLKDEGTILLQLKANDMSGIVKWRSYIEPFYVGDCIDAAGNYTGDLSAYEALVTRCVLIENAEVAREAAEDARIAAEAVRQTSEVAREAAEVSREQNTTTAINNTNAAKNETIEATASAEAKISDVEERFNRLTIEQQQDAEVIDARKGKDSLGLKIDDIDLQLSDSINVLVYGFDKTGISDNLSKWESLMAEMTAGQHITFPPGNYKINGELTITKPCTIDMYGAKLIFNNDLDMQGIRIKSSDVTITGIEIEGPQYSIANNTQIAIHANGTNATNYLRNINIRDCNVHKWMLGIAFEYVEYFNIENNKVNDIYYTAIQLKSCNEGSVNHNNINNVTADGLIGSNCYGIAVTKSNGTDLANPHSKNVFVDSNIISNIKTWEALDTHGGDRISFINNKIFDCRTGIAVVSYDVVGQKRGPSNCIVKGNTIYINHGDGELITTSDAGYGIVVDGDITESLAKNIIIAENIIDGYGSIVNTYGCAIYIIETSFAKFVNNQIFNSGNICIYIAGANDNLQIDGNQIDNVIGNSKYGIYVRKGNFVDANRGYAKNNIINIVGGIGIYIYDYNNDFHLINNEITADTRYSAGSTPNQKYAGRIEPYAMTSYTWDPNSIAPGGNESVVVNIPGMDGTMKCYLSADRYLLGLILSYQVAPNQVTLYLHNPLAAAINLASAKFYIRIDQ